MQIVLASQSPRRSQLLRQMGLEEFLVRPAPGEERMDPRLPPARLVEELSRQKADQAAALGAGDEVIIAADTVVALGDRVLGKPRDGAQAREMLRALSGRTHTVYTGVTVRRGERSLTGHEATLVTFRPLSEIEIEAYAASGEPMDKAGAYGIQGRGGIFVEGIRGDYFNVVGLPLCRLAGMLRQLGVDPWEGEVDG